MFREVYYNERKTNMGKLEGKVALVTGGATSRVRNCLWMAASHRCKRWTAQS